MIRCCIFDLDGTLLNTLDALTYTTNLTLKEFGYGPVDPEHIKQFVGRVLPDADEACTDVQWR